MADDITLTVRVRDLTRGDFNQLRQRMNGLGGDIRRLAQTSNLASDRAQRLGRDLDGVTGRLGQLQRSGHLANSEMQFMRRTMGLLGRDLRNAMRAGELSRDEFNALSRQLDDTRLGFDRLARDVERHNAVAQRAARDEARRQAEAQRMGQIRVRAQRMMQQEAERAERQQAQRRARELRQQQQAARQAAQALRQGVTRLAGAGDDGPSARFRAMGDADSQRMTRGLAALSGALGDVSGNSDRARRNIGALNGDLRVMSQVLQNAQRDGNLTQRELNALANGLRLTARGARDLRRSNDLSRAGFRGVRREVTLLQAQLRLLGGEGTRLGRLDDRLLVLQRRLRDSGREARFLRRGFMEIGEGGVVGMRGFVRGLGLLGRGLGQARERFRNASHGVKIFLLVLALIGPLAASVGAILTTALGGAFIALGAFALRADTQVRSAFSNMKDSIDSVLTESAEPMRDALVGGMNRIAQAAHNAGPALRTAFSAVAPLVDDVVEAVLGFGRSAMPGLVAALQRSGPVMAGFRTAMSDLGEGVGKLFDNMTRGAGAEGLQRAWQLIGGELENLLANLGNFIRRMSESETATALFIGIMRSFSGILHVVEAAFASVDAVAGSLFGRVSGWVSGMQGLSDATKRGAESIMMAGQSQKSLRDELKATEAEIKRIKRAQEDANVLFLPKNEPLLRQQKATEEDLANAQAKRKAILGALADAEGSAAERTREHAGAVQELKDAILGFNDVNISYFEAQTKAAEAVDKLTESFKENGNTLSLGTEEGLKNRSEMSGLARAYRELWESADKANVPLSEVREQTRGIRDAMIEQATAALGSKAAAQEYVNALLGTPQSVETLFKLHKEEAINGLKAVQAEIKATPNAESVTVTALTSEAIEALKAVGFKTETLPDGRTKVFTNPDGALGPIGAVEAALALLDGTTANTFTRHTINYHYTYTQARRPSDGATFLGPSGRLASGGLIRRAQGGPIQGFPSGGAIRGPGTRTSDSILARVSNGEFVMRAAAVEKYGPRFMQMLNSGRLELPRFHSGGMTKSEREARNAAVGELTVSRFGRFAGSRNSEFLTQLRKPNDRQDLVDRLNQARTLIQKTTHGRTEASLLRRLDVFGKALLKHEKNLSSVNKSLEKAKDKLDELKQSAAQLKESVSSRIVSEANITGAATAEDSQVTINTILSQMTASASNAKQFATMLKQLKARGLDKGLIAEIAEAGVEGGGMETAAAVLGAGPAQIKQLNKLRAHLMNQSRAAGDVAADAMFGAGIKSAEGLVKGLESRRKFIEKSMLAMATQIERSIKKALKIKSPSQVTMKLGDQTAEGFGLGIQRNRRSRMAWESMLTARPAHGAGSATAAAAASGQPIVIQLSLGGRNLGEVIIDPLRKAISHRGGNVQATLGN